MTIQLPVAKVPAPRGQETVLSQGNHPHLSSRPDEVPCLAAPDLAESIYAAVAGGMEFRSPLATARHHIENLLTAFGLAVSRNDASNLEKLTRSVRVELDGPYGLPQACAEEIIRWFDQESRESLQTLSNLSVRYAAQAVVYTAIYQMWDLNHEARCTRIGIYRGKLSAGPQVWRWEEHGITTLGPDRPGKHQQG